MEENIQAEEKAVETETTQVAPPTTEKPTTGAETVDKESVDQGSSSKSESVLPADTEEQRRAFQLMRQENKRLRDEIAGKKSNESAFNAFRAPTPPVGQPPEVRIENFIDPETGLTDYTAYNRAVNTAIQQATQTAVFTAQQTTQEILDENTARQKHSELFADPDLEQEIADLWFAAKMRGENISVSDVAERVAKRFKQTVSKAENIGRERALNEVSEKEKAGLVASGQTSEPARQQTSSEEQVRLSVRTRGGDNDALADRVSKIPWANK